MLIQTPTCVPGRVDLNDIKMTPNVLTRRLFRKALVGLIIRYNSVGSHTIRSPQRSRLFSSTFSSTEVVRRPGSSVTSRSLCSAKPLQKAEDVVSITFIDRDGDKTTVNARIGDTLLDVAKDNDIDVEGACEGTLACSTCHLIFDPDQFKKLPLEPPSEEELDMLDLAFGLTDTSRLGCQIVVTKELDGLVLTLPTGTSDARLS